MGTRKESLRSIEERNAMVEANMGLVGYVLGHYFRGNATDDNFQIGYIALMRAADLFDVSKGYKFTTYACKSIWGQINNAVRRKAKQEIKTRPVMEFDHPLDHRCPATIADDSEQAALHRKHTDLTSAGILDILPPRERRIIKGREMEGKTLQELGTEMGISKERVRQLQAAAMRRIVIAQRQEAVA